MTREEFTKRSQTDCLFICSFRYAAYIGYEIKERKLKAELSKLKDDRECFLSGGEECSNA